MTKAFAGRLGVITILPKAEACSALNRGSVSGAPNGMESSRPSPYKLRRVNVFMKLPRIATKMLPRSKALSPDDFWREAARYEHILYRAAFQYTGSRFDAEDLVQETFLAALRSRHQLRERLKLKAWLFVILRNHFLKRNRRRRGGPDQEYDDGIDYEYIDQLEIFAARENALQTLERKTTADEVHQRLKMLPERYRSVLIFYYLKEFSYREIADILEIPLGTVMSRLARGKQRLKTAMLKHSDRAAVGEKVIPLSRKGQTRRG